MRRSFRELVAGLGAMGPVSLRGQEFTGEALSTMVAINPETPGLESARTPRLISEFGRLTAAAFRDKEMVIVRYRRWRAQTIHSLTNPETAQNMGAVPAGSSKGLSKAAAEEFVRTLPGYMEHKQAVHDAEEVWASLHAAFEAAKARQWAVRAFERSGGPEINPNEPSPAPEDPVNVYHRGRDDPRSDLQTLEAQAASGVRTPIPPISSTIPTPPFNVAFRQ